MVTLLIIICAVETVVVLPVVYLAGWTVGHSCKQEESGLEYQPDSFQDITDGHA